MESASPPQPAEVAAAPPKRSRPPRAKPLPPVIMNLGIDFGTRFTKLCYRDVALEKSALINFSDDLQFWRHSLIASQVRLWPNEVIEAPVGIPDTGDDEEEFRTFDFLKMHLAGLTGYMGQRGAWPKPDRTIHSAERVEAVCAFYLYRVLTIAKEWIRQEERDRLAGRTVIWSGNIGVPVEFCDSPALVRFERVFKAAWRMAEEYELGESLLLPDLDRVYAEAVSRNVSEPDAAACFAIPEIAAAVYSFIISREAVPGVFVYFDVGGGTLDAVSFRFWRDQGQPRLTFYDGKVEPLGVNALAERAARNASRDRIRFGSFEEALLEEKYLGPLQEILQREVKQIEDQTVRVVWKVKKKDRLAWKMDQAQVAREIRYIAQFFPDGDAGLPLFLGGGGARSEFYRKSIINTYRKRNLGNCDVPEFQVHLAPCPPDLELSGIPAVQFHRFAIAYGLSIPHGEGPELLLPRQVDEMAALPKKRNSGQVNYDDNKDAYQ